MDKQIKIGIPKAFLYYRYSILWKKFFELLGIKVIISPETNKEIIERGKELSIDEACLSSKIYFGHVSYLVDKCDYLLVPRVSDYGKGNKVCVKFNSLYDQVRNLYPKIKILNYNLEKTKGNNEFLGMVKIGLKIEKNIFKVIYSYLKAKKMEKYHYLKLEQEQNNKLKSNKLKILVISHPYNIYDRYLGYPIIKYLEEMNIEIIYADRLNKKKAIEHSKKISNTLYWLYNKELIGSIEHYKKIVDGIIFLTTFPCGPDSLVNELCLRKIDNIPSLNLILDESSAEAGLHTRLESFIDMIKGRKIK